MPDEIRVAPVKTVYWPDLAPYGARLTVVHNPSLSRNFLKLTILDRAKFSRDAGHAVGSVDFFRLARDFDFVYAPAEASILFDRAYDAAIANSATEADARAQAMVESTKAYFYAPFLNVSQEMIKQLVPAAGAQDFRMLPVSDVKHLDFQYFPKPSLDRFLAAFQRTNEGEPGVFYTIPSDRDLLARVRDDVTPVNDLLGMRDKVVADVDEDLGFVASLNVTRIAKKAFSGLTLNVRGEPLKAIRMRDTVLGFYTFDAAVAANGGSPEGVVREAYASAAPIAFDWPSRRLLVVKNAEYLEIEKLIAPEIVHEEALAAAPAWHMQFLDAADELVGSFKFAKKDGILGADLAINDLSAARNLEAQYKDIHAKMAACLAAVPPSILLASPKKFVLAGYVDHVDLVSMSGLSAANFETTFSKEFLRFLGQFKNELQPSLDESIAKFEAQSVIESGLARAQGAPSSAVSNGKRQDAGEKIGGARKDFARRSLDLSDVEGMTERELFDLVNKNNVWAPIDYREMRDRGLDPALAYAIAQIRKMVPVSPLRGGWNIGVAKSSVRVFSAETCAEFVRAVSIVRDQVMNVDSQKSLVEAVFNIRREFGLPIHCYEYADSPERRLKAFGGRYSSQLPLHDAIGLNFTRKLPAVEIAVRGRADGLPAFRDAFSSSQNLAHFLALARVKTKNGWEWAIKEAPESSAAEGEDGTPGKKQRVVKPQPYFAHLDHIDRMGPSCREGSVNEQMLLSTFGFRGVEYGTWLPQAERQIVLDHAFDACMDLAEIMDLPPTALSLGGRLATAFGARGSGGANAGAAHYEHARVVMNFTRMRGAGFFAHEFGHALDYWVAASTGASAVEAFSEVYKSEPQNNAFVKHYKALFETIHSRPASLKEVVDGCLYIAQRDGEKKFVNAVLSRNLESWIRCYVPSIPHDLRENFRSEGLKLVQASFEPVPELAQYGVERVRSGEDLASELVALFRGMVGKESVRTKLDRDYVVRAAAWGDMIVGRAVKAIGEFQPGQAKMPSRFLAEAQFFDSYRSKPYWSTDIELFARAFESWVQDRVEAEPGRRSQYLVYGRGAAPEGVPSGYPQGEERKRIGAVFDTMFEELKSELLKAADFEKRPSSTAEVDWTS
jgi:hypothetical protein